MRKNDIFLASALSVVLLAFFWRTVFFGAAISRAALLPEWDSLYSAFWTGHGGNCDPSLVQLLMPNLFKVANLWHAGQLPLWNPYAGFGVPLVGDPQALVFSPIHVLLNIFPNMRVYNLTLVFEVIFGAIGSYLFARAMRLPAYACLFAGLTYAICPYVLYYLELIVGNSYILFPWLFWLFVRLAEKPSASRSIACGAGCAALILSGHPESAFFGITFATLLALVLTCLGSLAEHKPAQLFATIKAVGSAALVCCCLAAPLLLPFIEFLGNCDSYKLTIGGSTWVPLGGIAYNLMAPGFGPASPFLGVVAACLLPLAALSGGKCRRVTASVAIVCLLALLVTARLGPLQQLMTVRPLNCLITVYCLPVFLLLLTILCSFGLVELVSAGLKSKRHLMLVLVSALLMVSVPLILRASHVSLASGDFDMMLPHMAVDWKGWCLETPLLLLAMSFILCANRLQNVRFILPLALVAINFASQAVIARQSMPVQPHFNYPIVQPIDLLAKNQARFVALGDHLFKPNTATLFGIADIRMHNPVFPDRYISFMQAAGARVDLFNQYFDSASNRLLDIASVNFALSLEPLNANDFGCRLVSKTPQGIYVYSRLNALPRAFIVHEAIVARNKFEALQYVQQKDFDFHHKAVIESANLPYLQSPTPARADLVLMRRTSDSSVQLETHTEANGLLILNDAYYPGWQARLDGNPVPIFRANYLFRGVFLPSGLHRLEFFYQPVSFLAGIVAFIICLLTIVLYLVMTTRRSNVEGKLLSAADHANSEISLVETSR